jgi:hypothetical protein
MATTTKERIFSSEGQLTEFIAEYIQGILSGKESEYHQEETKRMQQNTKLPQRTDLKLEVLDDGSVRFSYTEADGTTGEATYPSLAIMVVCMLASSLLDDSIDIVFHKT